MYKNRRKGGKKARTGKNRQIGEKTTEKMRESDENG